MAISAVSLGMQSPQAISNTNTTPVTSYEAQQNFATTLKDAIANVNGQQIQSDELTTKLINGDDVELHEVMIAAQKATISLNLTMEIRNKAVEAYQEMMRMSI